MSTAAGPTVSPAQVPLPPSPGSSHSVLSTNATVHSVAAANNGEAGNGQPSAAQAAPSSPAQITAPASLPSTNHSNQDSTQSTGQLLDPNHYDPRTLPNFDVPAESQGMTRILAHETMGGPLGFHPADVVRSRYHPTREWPLPYTIEYDPLPFHCRPVQPPERRARKAPRGVIPQLVNDQRWLRKGDQANVWLGLRFDLVIAAMLQVFGQTHVLRSAADLPAFTMYFIIVHSLWAAQVHYDIRYEANDRYHWFMKGVQMLIFCFAGAAGSSWDPLNIKIDNSLGRREISMTALSGLLAFQYMLAFFLAKDVQRSCRREAISMCSNFASALCAVAAAVIPATSRSRVAVKLAFVYMAVAIEFIVQLWMWYGTYSTPNTDLVGISERCSSMSLIVLGESFIQAMSSFAASASVLYHVKASTYLQIALVIIIAYLLWSLLFQLFDVHQTVYRERAAIWEIVHIPLHFAIFLFVAAITNVVVHLSFMNATKEINVVWSAVMNITVNHHIRLDSSTLDRYADVVAHSKPTLNFSSVYEAVWARVNRTTEADGVLAEMDLYDEPAWLGAQEIVSKYRLSTNMAVYGQFGMPFSPEIEARQEQYLKVLNNFNAASNTNAMVQAESSASLLKLEAGGESITYQHLEDEILAKLQNETVDGTVWLFPTAGTILILSVIRSKLRYRLYWWGSSALRGAPLIVGAGLCSLAALYTTGGSGHYEFQDGENVAKPSTLIKLIDSEMALMVVALSYSLATIVPSFFVKWLSGARKRYDIRMGGTATPPAEPKWFRLGICWNKLRWS